MKLANNFEEILIAFNRQKVDYLIAGGYAVIFHGYGRTTGDLDLWVNPVMENKEKIMKAFKELKFPDVLLEHIRKTDFAKPFAVKIGKDPIQVDLFNAITGVIYAEATARAIPYKFSDKCNVRFINLYDLVTNKMLTGRLKDAADVDELHKINRHSKDKSILNIIKKLFKK